MIDPVTAAGIAAFSANTIATYFINKGLDLGFSEDSFKERLREVIDKTVEDYDDKFPQESGRLLPFYHSVNVIDELLKFRVMHPEEYDPAQLTQILEAESGIMPPTQKNIADFYDIFLSNINADFKLKELAIKQTFEQEIFDISKKVDNISRQMHSISLAMDGDLQLQWKNRLDTYTDTLRAFKPATAIKLLEQLEDSFATSKNKPNQHLKALLSYQKGVCQQFLGEIEKSAKSYIEAYRLDSENTLYHEQAALAHFKLDNPEKSTEMATELIALDSYSTMGWALKLLGTKEEEFNTTFEQVPKLVAKNDDFQKIVHNMLMNKDKMDLLNLLYKENRLSSPSEFKEFEITITSYNLYVFWILNAVNRYLKKMYVDFREPAPRDNDLIIFLNERLKKLISTIQGTEIEDHATHFKFLLAFTDFMMTREESFALEMQKHYQNLDDTSFFNAIQCANALQQIGKYHEAIDIIRGRNSKEPEMLMLLAHCYSRTEQDELYIKAIKSFFGAIDKVPDNYLLTYLNSMLESALHGFSSNFTATEFTENKTFDNPIHSEIINLFSNLLYGEIIDQDANRLLVLAQEIPDKVACAFIAIGFYFVSQYDRAITAFRSCEAGSESDRTLYYYLQSLLARGTDEVEVLELLKKWRTEVDFDQGFILRELQMRRDLREWDEVSEICEIYLNEIPQNEGVINLYFIALNEIGGDDSQAKLKELASKVIDYAFTEKNHIINVGTILIRNGFPTEGFELLYQFAKDPSQIEIRTAYLQACLISSRMNNKLEPMEQFDTVQEGNFVKYTTDRKVHFVEMTPRKCVDNVFRNFMGRKPGDHFTVKRPLTNQEDIIRIERIMNKYLSLHDEIYEQVASDPYSGIPFTAINIDPDNPGNIFLRLQEMFGDSGAKAKIMAQQELEKYYGYKISFTDVVINPHDKKYLDAYSALSTGKGIATIPLRDFANKTIGKNRIVIDFSSTLMLFQISSNHQVQFENKFIVSRYLQEHIKHLLQELEVDLPTNLSVTITDAVPIVQHKSENFHRNQLAYVKGLLNWINNNCEVELPNNMLEVARQANVTIGQNFVIDIVLSTMLLTQQSNHLIVSDDFFYLKHGFLNINMMRSTELFIKNIVGFEHECLDEFINNRYIGFSPNDKQLNESYLQHLTGQPNNYGLCIENLSARNSQQNFTSAIKHIKYITLNAVISPDQMETDITAVWVGVLRNMDISIKHKLKSQISSEFALLGLKLDLVLRALGSAYKILEMEH